MQLAKLTNAEYQRLGKVSRVTHVYLLDDFGERVRSLPIGSEKDSRYKASELEIVIKKPYDTSKVFVDTEPCLF